MYAVRNGEPSNDIECGNIAYNVYWDTEPGTNCVEGSDPNCECDSTSGICQLKA